MVKPLEGIKVIELATYIAAPVTAKMLGEWGAEVIKIEPHFGDEYRVIGQTLQMPTDDLQNPCFDLENEGKRLISLNLKTQEGLEILNKLIKQSDCLITNYRPEALEKLHMTYEEVSKLNPKIVYGQLVGYGLKGMDSSKAGFDLTAFFARSGIMIDMAEKDTAPLSPVVGFGDHATGLALTSGVLAAIIKQIRTGEGEKVISGLYQTSLYLSGSMIAGSEYGVDYPITRTKPLTPLVNTYKCKDEKWILLSGTSYDHYWDNFCRNVLKDENLANEEKYQGVRNMIGKQEEMTAILDKIFLTKTRDEWEELLNKADIANEKILHWKDVLKDEQAWANEYLYEANYENGNKSTLVRTPVDFGSFKKEEFSFTPKIGADTKEVLKELNYTDEEIERLQNEKKIK